MIQSVDKALLLLASVAANGEWSGVRDLARRTGLNASTAHHLLKTLKDRGFLESDSETGRYRIGVAAVMIGASSDPVQRLGDAAKPSLDALYDKIGSVVVGLMFERGSFVSNYWKQDQNGVVFSAPLRTPVPKPHLMACGQVLMAWRERAWQESYLKEFKLPSSLLKSLAKIRDEGLCELENCDGSGLYALGVAVNGIDGRPVMAIGWSMPASAVSSKARAEVRKSMASCASALSYALRFESKRS